MFHDLDSLESFGPLLYRIFPWADWDYRLCGRAPGRGRVLLILPHHRCMVHRMHPRGVNTDCWPRIVLATVLHREVRLFTRSVATLKACHLLEGQFLHKLFLILLEGRFVPFYLRTYLLTYLFYLDQHGLSGFLYYFEVRIKCYIFHFVAAPVLASVIRSSFTSPFDVPSSFSCLSISLLSGSTGSPGLFSYIFYASPKISHFLTRSPGFFLGELSTWCAYGFSGVTVSRLSGNTTRKYIYLNPPVHKEVSIRISIFILFLFKLHQTSCQCLQVSFSANGFILSFHFITSFYLFTL